MDGDHTLDRRRKTTLDMSGPGCRTPDRRAAHLTAMSALDVDAQVSRTRRRPSRCFEHRCWSLHSRTPPLYCRSRLCIADQSWIISTQVTTSFQAQAKKRNRFRLMQRATANDDECLEECFSMYQCTGGIHKRILGSTKRKAKLTRFYVIKCPITLSPETCLI